MTDVIGGAQSPQELLNKVMKAVIAGDISELQEARTEFMSIPENLVKCVDTNGNTIAHLAVQKDTAVLEYVTRFYNANLNAVNLHGKTPLHTAVTNNFVAACKFILKNGGKDDPLTHAQSTPFHTAAACGSVECLEVLLEYHANGDERKRKEKLDEVDRNKCTALHKCAYDGGLRVAMWLVNNGATVDSVDIHDTTPLLCAAKMGRADICSFLISKGADPKRSDDKGNSVAHYAASKCLPGIFELALKYDASITEANAEFNTPLHLACMNPHPEQAGWEEIIFRILRAQGKGALEVKNVAGKTPVMYLPRDLQPRVSVEFMEKAETARKQDQANAEAAAKQAQEKRHALLSEKRSAIEERERQLREEADRLQREAEDRLRAEEDARIRMDEELEAKRLEEEEARKKKEGKAKGGDKKKK